MPTIKRFGRNNWRSLVQPAIKFAEDGFVIHRALAIAIERSRDFILDKQNFPGLKYKEICYIASHGVATFITR